MLNLSVLLQDSAQKYPDKAAFIFMDTALNYEQINAMANQVANGLRARGIRPGDKIALSCLNLPYFPVLYYGILRAGAIVVPLSVLLKRNEIAYHLQDADVRAYFSFVGTDELPMDREARAAFDIVSGCEQLYLITASLADPSPMDAIPTLGALMQGQPTTAETHGSSPDDTAVIVYTSGTTGKPKGAELTHSNLLLNAIVSADLLHIINADRQLIVLPLFHIFAMTVLLNAGVYRGTTNVLLPRFDAQAVMGLLQKHSITVFAGVPTMYWGLLNNDTSAYDMEAIKEQMRVAVSGGASLPVKVLEEFEKKFQVPIVEGYGMSEGSPVVTFNHLDRERKPGSIGTPVWGVEVMIADENDEPLPPGEKGQLLYRGHNVMKGYYKRPDANAKTLKGGWMHSGDVAIMDEAGYYYIVDRTKDMIIRGGLNVYPREVEDALMQHDAVSMAAVIGIPHDEHGEEIKACVVLKEGKSITDDELIDWTRERIAAYKYPRAIEFLQQLPMSATGKILKKELRAREKPRAGSTK